MWFPSKTNIHGLKEIPLHHLESFVRNATGKASGLRPAFLKETLEKSRSIYLRNVQEPVSLVGIPPMALDEVLDSIDVHPDSGTPITDGLPMGLF
jgi:hypothetical protein